MRCSGGAVDREVAVTRATAVRRAGRRLRAAGAATAVVVAIASCGSVPDAEPTANALATALTSRDFNDVPLAGASARDATLALTEITERMGDSTWTVAVQAVDEVADHEGEG